MARQLPFVAMLCMPALALAAGAQIVINDFEGSGLTGIRPDNRGMQHPSKAELNADPDFVKEGKQSLRFALDMSRKGSYSYCILWLPVPKRPTMDLPAVALWVRAKKGVLIGNFTFYIGGSPKFRSKKHKFMAGDWRRVVISDWNRLTGAKPSDWTNVRRFSFIATNGNDAELYFDDIRFVTKAEADALAPCEQPDVEEPKEAAPKFVRCTPLYGMQRLVFHVPDDCPFPPDELKSIRVAARIRTEEGREVRSVTIAGFGTGTVLSGLAPRQQKTVDISDLKPGVYALTCTVRAGTQDLETHSMELRIPSPEPWHNQRIGASALDPDHVLPPWEPVKVRDSVVSVWARDYELGALSLPQQITSAGQPILAAPVALVVKTNGSRAAPEGAPAIVGTHRGLCRARGEGSVGKVNVQVETQIEYDGLVSVSLTIEPDGTQTIEEATLEIPFRSEHTSAFHYQPYLASGGIIPYGGTKIPRIFKEQPGSGRIPEDEGVVWERPYSPLMWIGSHHRGLCFFVESEEGFYPQELKERGSRTVIRRDGDRVSLVIRLVSKPVATAEPLRYRFGFMATPIKPMPKGWRDWRVTSYRTKIPEEVYAPGTGNLHIYWQYFTRKYGVLDPNLARPDAFARAAAKDHTGNHAVMPYYAPQWIIAGIYDPITEEWPCKNPAFDTYFPEWRTEPYRTVQYPTGPPKVTRTYSASMSDNSWAEYLLWLMREQARRGADGYYSDCAGPSPDSNPVYGCGYRGRDGGRYPTFNLAPKRRLLKRALQMYREERGPARARLTGLGIMHGTAVSPILVPFFDARLDGEFERTNLENLVRKNRNVPPYFYGRLYDLEEFRIQYAGEKFGIPMIFLPELKWVSDTTDLLDEKTMVSKAATRDFLLMTLLTDTLVWPIWCNSEEVYKTWTVKDRFGIGDPDVEYFPYWSDSSPVKTGRGDVKVTLYRKPGRLLAIVGNISFEPRTVALRLAPSQLERAAFVDGMSGERFAATAGQVAVSLPPRDFRMLLWDAEEAGR